MIREYLKSQPDTFEALFKLSPQLDFQDSAMQILEHYGVSDLFHSLDEFQINCPLPSHGTLDTLKSARYYTDSATGTDRVHCFKCQKTLTGFYIYYNIEKDAGKDLFTIVEDYIKLFDIQIDFEKLGIATTQSTSILGDIKTPEYKQQVEYIRNKKLQDPDFYRQKIMELLK